MLWTQHPDAHLPIRISAWRVSATLSMRPQIRHLFGAIGVTLEQLTEKLLHFCKDFSSLIYVWSVGGYRTRYPLPPRERGLPVSRSLACCPLPVGYAAVVFVVVLAPQFPVVAVGIAVVSLSRFHLVHLDTESGGVPERNVAVDDLPGLLE